MESAGQEVVGVEKEQTTWAREYPLRWSKACFLLGMVMGGLSVWDVWRSTVGFQDKVNCSTMLLIPAALGIGLWRTEKRGEIEKQLAGIVLMFLGMLTSCYGEAFGAIVHAARAAAGVAK